MYFLIIIKLLPSCGSWSEIKRKNIRKKVILCKRVLWLLLNVKVVQLLALVLHAHQEDGCTKTGDRLDFEPKGEDKMQTGMQLQIFFLSFTNCV